MVVCGQKGNNVSLLLAISPQLGVVRSQFFTCPSTKPLFQAFIDNVVNRMSVVDEESLVIMDNASIHAGVTSSREGITMKYLPAYSSPLNPIEEAFSAWKAAVKQKLSEPAVLEQVMSGEQAAAAGMNLHQWRLHHLVRIAKECVPTVTQGKCLRFFNHSVGFLHRCLNSEDI